jgi:D-alanine-D-alanine ligase
MTAESQVPRMFAAAGLRYEQLVARLVDAAAVPGLGRSPVGV